MKSSIGWKPPGGSYYRGGWRDPERMYAVIDPEDSSVVGEAGDLAAHHVKAAVDALVADPTDWPLWQRREAIQAAARRVATMRDCFAAVIASEGIKTITEARAEVCRAIETLELTARSSGALAGETVDLDDSRRGHGRIGWYTREPLGVVAVISSYNDPLNLVVHKAGPALLAGNHVAVKPSEHTPLTALLLAQVLLESGVPPGRLAVLTGSGPTVGETLVRHPGTALVSFTGGRRVGNLVASAAGAKPVLMELGGNCSVIVCDDARLDTVAREIVAGAFGCAGQNCISVQRVLASAPLFEPLLEKVRDRVSALSVGSKSSESTDVGPLISQAAASRVESWVREARESGATLVSGGTRDGVFHSPTVLSNVPRQAAVWRNEVFGPVVCINKFTTDEEAVAAANGCDFGLHAGIFTRDLERAFWFAKRLDYGAVMINGSSDFRLDSMPFGGTRGSSVGREGVRFAIHAMSQPKVVTVRTLDDPATAERIR